MQCSVPIWPTASNPASFLPVAVNFYPFDDISGQRIYENKNLEVCPSCKKYVDSQFTWEGDKCKCSWCSKIFKPIDQVQAQDQNNKKRFLLRKPTKNPIKRLFIIAIDACCTVKDITILKKFVVTAISTLPENYPFLLCILKSSYNIYVYVFDSTVVYFDIPHSIHAYNHINLDRDAATPKMLDILKPFIDKIEPESEKSNGVNDLIKQLRGKPDLFVRILLFSPRGPAAREERNISVDWVSPSKVDGPVNIDGYYLDGTLFGTDKAMTHEQIKCIVRRITTEDTIYNVTITAYITNYRINCDRFNYASAVGHFCQPFELSAQKLFGTSVSSLLGIETSCLRICPNGECYFEIQWVSDSFLKSDDFVPVVSGLDARLIIPQLIRERSLNKFVKRLMSAYHEHCGLLPGCVGDNTFALFPNLQWLLRVEFGDRGDIFNDLEHMRASIPAHVKTATFYPLLTLWNNQNECLATGCPVHEFFYMQMGSPPIAIVDEVTTVTVYTNEEIEENSVLKRSLDCATSERFPTPVIIIHPLSDIIDIFRTTEDLYQRVCSQYAEDGSSLL